MFLILITCRFHICDSISSPNLICKTINTVRNLYYSKTLKCVSPAKFKRSVSFLNTHTLNNCPFHGLFSATFYVVLANDFSVLKSNQRQCWKFAKLGKSSDEFNIPKSCSLRKHPHQVSSVPVWVCAGVYEFESL